MTCSPTLIGLPFTQTQDEAFIARTIADGSAHGNSEVTSHPTVDMPQPLTFWGYGFEIRGRSNELIPEHQEGKHDSNGIARPQGKAGQPRRGDHPRTIGERVPECTGLSSVAHARSLGTGVHEVDALDIMAASLEQRGIDRATESSAGRTERWTVAASGTASYDCRLDPRSALLRVLRRFKKENARSSRKDGSGARCIEGTASPLRLVVVAGSQLAATAKGGRQLSPAVFFCCAAKGNVGHSASEELISMPDSGQPRGASRRNRVRTTSQAEQSRDVAGGG